MQTTRKFQDLGNSLNGVVATPGDPRFETLRSAWNLTIGHTPSVIVEATTTEDVQAAMRFASESGMNVTVQSTGHGQPRCCDGGMLLRMNQMNSVSVDANAKTAKVGGGAVWADVIRATVPHGLAPISGSSPGVGVVGYLLGGGYGLMSRHYGLAADNLLSAKVVLPDGRAVTASPQENADLFFAVRGGGGAFGAIVELEIGLVPHGEVFGGNVMFDSSYAPTILKAWSAWTKTAPDSITSALVLITFPPVPFVPEFLQGRSMAIFVACASCSAHEAEAALAPMRSLEGAEFDSFRWMSYAESGSIFNDPVDPMPVIGNGAMLRAFDDDTIDAFLSAVGPIPRSPNLMIQIRQVGGAIERVPVGETPVGDRRSAQFLSYFLGVPMGPYTPEAIVAHAESCIAALAPWTLVRGPLNWIGEANVPAEALKDVFDGATFARLLDIKKRIDPENILDKASVGVWLSENPA